MNCNVIILYDIICLQSTEVENNKQIDTILTKLRKRFGLIIIFTPVTKIYEQGMTSYRFQKTGKKIHYNYVSYYIKISLLLIIFIITASETFAECPLHAWP